MTCSPRTSLPLAFAAALTLAMVACGGGGGGSSNTTGTTTTTSGGGAAAPLVITTTSLPDALVGTPYSGVVSSSGGTAPITWSVSGASWLSIDSSTGKLTGTPPDNANTGLNIISVFAKDSATPQHSVGVGIRMYVAGKLGGLIPTTINGIANRFVPFTYGFQPGGGKPPYTATITAGALPPGVSVAGSDFGVTLSGTPTASGTFTYTLQVTDSLSTPQVISASQSLVVEAKMAIPAANLPAGIVGRSYQGNATVVNSTPPLHWSNLPSGIVGDDLGNFSGIPTAVAFSVVTVTDSSTPPQFAVAPGQLNVVDQLRIPRGSTMQTRIGQLASFTVPVTGGIQPFAFFLQSGLLPPGLSLSSNSVISGTPTQTGTFTFGVHAVDSANPPETYDEPFTIQVLPPQPSFIGTNLPTAVANRPYSAQLAASGGTPPYSWNATGGVPAGLSLDSTGNLTGTPLIGGSYNFNVQVTDFASPPQSATGVASILVRQNPLGRNDSIASASPLPAFAPTLSISPNNDTSQGTPDTDYFKGYGNAGATVSVAATVGPNSPLDPVIEIVDPNGQRFQTCNDPILKNPPPPIVADTNWGNFADECINDDANPGVNHNSSLDFKVPGTSGTQMPFYVHVFDWRGDARPDAIYSLNVSGNIPAINIGVPTIAATVGIPYQSFISTGGGTGAITLQLTSGNVPPGINLSSNGQLSGTPTTKGTYSFTLTATDSGNPAQQATATLAIDVATPVSVSGALPAGTSGVIYSQKITVSGGRAPYTYFFSPGTWCTCLNFDQITGVVSGTPAAPKNYTGFLNVSDSQGRFASATITVPISAGPLFLVANSMPSGTNGWIYDQLIPVQGGTPPYAFTITSGSIPAGLTFDAATGDLRGIPTAAGTYSFAMSITDSGSPTKQSISAPMTITIQ